MEKKEVKLPSGATLTIQVAPWGDANDLFEAVTSEFKTIDVTASGDVINLFKNIYCTGFSSRLIKQALWKCLSRCLYNGAKIDNSTFEPVQNREDYTVVCREVMQENLNPFTKNLFVDLKSFVEKTESIQQ